MPLSWPYHAAMPTLVASPTRIQAVGNKPKMIEEYVGRVTTGHRDVSVARMLSPEGWVEPGQAPQFDEVTVVLAGCLRVTSADGELDVAAGQAVVVSAGEWVRYSTPEAEGAEYIAGQPSPELASMSRREDHSLTQERWLEARRVRPTVVTSP
jgi:mannose-6-phosphate isomerase-like protein (cupin superfamily)